LFIGLFKFNLRPPVAVNLSFQVLL